MNNAMLTMERDSLVEENTDTSARLRAREAELVKIIEAVRRVEVSEEWSTLKRYVFDGVLESLERRMASEATRLEVNPPEMYRLQGQIAWAKKYSKLDTLAEAFRLELTNIRRQLNPPAERV